VDKYVQAKVIMRESKSNSYQFHILVKLQMNEQLHTVSSNIKSEKDGKDP